MDISIVIPAFNEEARIGVSLKKISDYLKKNSKKYDYEIIIVDDASKDNTIEIVERIKDPKIRIIKNKRNRGKGYSVKRGILSAKKEWVLFTDADLSTPISEIEKFDVNSGYDIFIGSRNLKQSKILVKQPFLRSRLGKIFPLLARIFLVRDIKDTQCGFKMFRQEAAQKIFNKQTLDRYSFDVEVLYLARKYGFKTKEVPIVWINSDNSKVNIFRDCPKMFSDLIRIKMNDWAGRYEQNKKDN